MRLMRGDIWSPVSVTPGQGRAVTLALLCEAATWNAARAPNPTAHQRRGRRRGLSALFHNHPYNPSGDIGMGRARSKDSDPCPFPEPSL